MTSTLQSSRHILSILDDIVRFAMSEFLSPLERVMFVSSMAPLNDAHDASNNQHISYLTKQLLEDDTSKGGLTLDLNLLGDDVLARMADVDLYRILKHVSSFVNTFRLGNCTKVEGWGLAPLKDSSQLRSIDMSKIASGECQLQEKMTLPILQSIINTSGSDLRVVQVPMDWRVMEKENKLLHSFMLAFDDKLKEKDADCKGCGSRIASNSGSDRQDKLKYFTNGDKDMFGDNTEYGLQKLVCYECLDAFYDDGVCCYIDKCGTCQTAVCMDKCSTMKCCDYCEKDFCVQCKDVRKCRDCSNKLCSDYYTEREYVCDRCDSMVCCVDLRDCDGCHERKCCVEHAFCYDNCEQEYCAECRPNFVMRCNRCGAGSCKYCCKVGECFYCKEATCRSCEGGLCGICTQWYCSSHGVSTCDVCKLVSCERCAQVDNCEYCSSWCKS